MTLCGFETLPPAIAGQLEELTVNVADLLGENLVGIYLHGSLAMGCFNPTRSDLDLLLVIDQGLTLEEKRQIGALLLRISGHPSPLEISILTRDTLKKWTFPTPFDFHYSEGWREQTEKEPDPFRRLDALG